MTSEELTAEIRASAKYRALSPELIARIAAEELARRGSSKEALKETRSRLHQLAGAYITGKIPYNTWLQRLETAPNLAERNEICRSIMRSHASSSERLEHLGNFYSEILDGIGPVASVLDLACGLNPLAIPWMGLPENAVYYAVDLYEDLAAFLNRFFPLIGLRGEAAAADLITAPPTQAVDLALVLKLLPVLEQQGKGMALKLLHSLQARHILVSYPTRTLGGHSKGMRQVYERQFLALMEQFPGSFCTFEFTNELCFLITPANPATEKPAI